MTQKTYRRVTRFLFCFLFLVFFLLYLLLSQRYDRAGVNRGGGGWRNRSLALGAVTVSEVRSGGFILDEFPFPGPTAPEKDDFLKNVLVCRAELINEGGGPVDVTVGIHGTALAEGGGDANPGLCGGFYYYEGETDPIGGDYASLLSDPGAGLKVYDRGERNMELYLAEGAYPTRFRMEPGGARTLVLFFWVDEDEMDFITDLDREGYSVTVKLTSRGA